MLVGTCLVSSSRLYLFDRPICTGLGDRVGTMLALAALARVENARIAYLWCEDPKRLKLQFTSQSVKNSILDRSLHLSTPDPFIQMVSYLQLSHTSES